MNFSYDINGNIMGIFPVITIILQKFLKSFFSFRNFYGLPLQVMYRNNTATSLILSSLIRILQDKRCRAFDAGIVAQLG